MDERHSNRQRIDPDVAEARLMDLLGAKSRGLTSEEIDELLTLAIRLCGECGVLRVEIKGFLTLLDHYWPAKKPKSKFLQDELAYFLGPQEPDPSDKPGEELDSPLEGDSPKRIVAWVEAEVPKPRPKGYKKWMARTGISNEREVYVPINVLGPRALFTAINDGTSIVEYEGVTYVPTEWVINECKSEREKAAFATNRDRILEEFDADA
ncbi:hypothetical protein V5E97_10575 [Singulisphaera sp. Ch08]|uniref:Uncharacterized protein n=1 Tax=Singulisphaera sp. Ch08 TaxID=3120278 RepID=A0AAU7CM13_9BACT